MLANVYEKMYDDLSEKYIVLKEMEHQYDSMKTMVERMFKSGMEGYANAVYENNKSKELSYYNQAITCGMILGINIMSIDADLKKMKELNGG